MLMYKNAFIYVETLRKHNSIIYITTKYISSVEFSWNQNIVLLFVQNIIVLSVVNVSNSKTKLFRLVATDNFSFGIVKFVLTTN